MDTPSLLWLVIFFVAASLFFVTAVFITVIGVKDLKDLLSTSVKVK